MTAFHMSLVTPSGVIFEGDVLSVSAPGCEGSFQVLGRHAPLTALLKKGVVKIVETTKKQHCFEITGGFLEVSQNRLILLADEAFS